MKRIQIGIIVTLISCIVLFVSGCESCNSNPNNKRFWFPSLESPGHLDPGHQYYTPDGCSAYPDANIGPRGIQTCPNGYDLPRSRVTEALETREALGTNGLVK